MLKVWGVLAFVGLAACGEIPTTVSKGVGEIRSVDPLTVSNMGFIQDICNAVQTKTGLLSSLMGTRYTFDYSERSCDQAALGAPVATEVYLANVMGYKFYDVATNAPFYFQEVETSTSGILGSICSKGSGLTNPVQIGANWVYLYTSGISAADCSAGVDEACLYLEQGADQGNGTAKIHTKEWIRVKIRNEKEGFFLERRLISKGTCQEAKTIGRHAILR
jgi:hypothetical protein